IYGIFFQAAEGIRAATVTGVQTCALPIWKHTRRISSAREKKSQVRQPKPLMPKQHQRKPGIESKVDPRPRYEAPLYKGSGKLEEIGRASCRERVERREVRVS